MWGSCFSSRLGELCPTLISQCFSQAALQLGHTLLCAQGMVDAALGTAGTSPKTHSKANSIPHTFLLLSDTFFHGALAQVGWEGVFLAPGR